jgi:uncharacterized protein (TIGR00369 family)
MEHSSDTLSTIPAERLAEILAVAKEAPCLKSLSMRLLECHEGRVRVSARQDPAYAGLLPGFHGGMLANVADCAAWCAIVSVTGPREPLVTTDLNLRYLAPCLGDVIASGRVIKLGRTLCPVNIELHDASGRLVAWGMVTYLRVSALGASQ